MIAVLGGLLVVTGALVFGGPQVGCYVYEKYGMSSTHFVVEAFKYAFAFLPVALLAVGISLAAGASRRGRRARWYAAGGFVAWVLLVAVLATLVQLARVIF